MKTINIVLVLILITNPILALSVGDVNSQPNPKTKQNTRTYKPKNTNRNQQNNNYDIYYIEQLAQTDAQIDAQNNSMLWATGTFLTSLVASPLLGGSVMTLVAYQSKGQTTVPYYRYSHIEEEYGQDAASTYSSMYSFEKGEKQRKSNGKSALGGALAAWGFFIILFANSN